MDLIYKKMWKMAIIAGVLALVGLLCLPKNSPEPTMTLGANPEAIGYYAELDQDGVVLRVIVARQSFIDSGLVGDPKNWVETKVDGSKKYAGKGDVYDKNKADFVSPVVDVDLSVVASQ